MNPIVLSLTEADIKRFWSKVDVQGTDDCWLWLGAITDRRYGTFSIQDISVLAHPIASYLVKGLPEPIELHTCHHCDNPPCCNPFHHFYGTRQDNMSDSVRKGRHGMQNHPDSRPKALRNGNARLTTAQVEDICSAQLTRAELSQKHHVSVTWVGFIQRGLWRRSG